MKKIYSIIFMMLILLSCTFVYAGNINIVVSPQKVMVNGVYKDFEVYNIDGNNYFKLRDIAYVLNKTTSTFGVNYNGEKQMIEVSKGSEYLEVGGELTIGEDKSSTATLSTQKLSIDNTEKNLTAYNIGGNNFFKLRELGSELDFEVDFDSANNTVVIDSKKEELLNITNVVAKIFSGVMYVEITTDSPVYSYNIFNLTAPDRLIIDLPNSNLKVDSKEVNVNYGNISKIRMGYQGENINRIVLDLNSMSTYKVVQSPDKMTTCLALSDTFSFSDLTKTPDNILLVYNGSLISIPNDGSTSSGDINSGDIENGDNNLENDDKIWTEEELNNRIKITSIKYSATTNKLKITGNKAFEYDSFLLENPYRVIVDIKNAVLSVDGPTTINPNNKNISEIRFSQKEIDVVRVVIDLKSEAEYSIDESGKTISVELEEVVGGKLQYDALKNLATLTLYDVSKSTFSITTSSKNNTYTLKYSTSKFNPKEDVLEIDDNFVENITITNGKIVIAGAGDTVFSIKQKDDDVVITMKTEEKNDDDFIILLDAGHGGSDPGAINGDNYEKNFNLAILLKLRDLLEENGYTVYTTRSKDVTLTVDDRVELATKEYPEASLYISIHNNSVANEKYTGTLIMYCDRDTSEYNITNRELAGFVLEELVSNLGTVNRGFIKVAENDNSKRILTEVPMPSILCEVAFVSNDEEVARLATEEFQESAALAIYNGILKAKEEMGM